MNISIFLILTLISSNLFGRYPSASLTNPPTAISQDTLNQQLADAILAGSAEEVKKAVSAGADVNYMDSDGKTPVWLAMLLGNLEVAYHLLESGAKGDITYRGKPFARVVLDAAYSGRNDPLSIKVITLLIINGVDFAQVKTSNGNDLRGFAINRFLNHGGSQGQLELLEQLEKRGYKMADYMWNMAEGNRSFSVDLINFCIKNGININKPGSRNLPALFSVIASDSRAPSDQERTIENLLNAGADMNIVANPDGDGPQTPLDCALSNASSDAIRILMQRGAKTYKQLQAK